MKKGRILAVKRLLFAVLTAAVVAGFCATPAFATEVEETVEEVEEEKAEDFYDVTEGYTAPGKVVITSCKKKAGTVILTWKKKKRAEGYEIYRSTSKSGEYTLVATIESDDTLTWTDQYLAGDTTYYYKIRAYLTVNDTKLYGAFSAVSKIKMPYSRKAILNIARSYLGTQEQDENHLEILSIYNSYEPLAGEYVVKSTDAWCATFVSAVFIKANYTALISTECSCRRMVTLLKEMGCWVEKDAYVPSPGDLIFYDWQDDGVGNCTGTPDHIGIVESVDGKIITVIEGNYDNCVKRRTIKVNGRYIRGFGVLDYTGN